MEAARYWRSTERRLQMVMQVCPCCQRVNYQERPVCLVCNTKLNPPEMGINGTKEIEDKQKK